MAEFVFVSFVVERLGDALLGKAASLHKVHDRVDEMRKELNWIQCFLKDADDKEERDERLRLWVSEIRDTAYDIEDVMDTFNLKIHIRSRKNFIQRSTSVLKKWNDLRIIDKEIRAIQARFRNISVNRYKYSGNSSLSQGHYVTVGSPINENTSRWRRLLPHTKEQEKGSVVALEGSTTKLVALLMEEDEHLRVISIIGMGGLGKTTLALKVYNHEDVKNCFDCCLWVYVSKDYSLIGILQAIVVNFNGINRDEMEILSRMKEEHLFSEIYTFLETKRYLVVLDDVWTTEAWDILKPAFPNGKAGSKVMVISRNIRVALYADSQTEPYEPKCLTEDESWELFCHKAFPGKDCPDNLVELGKKMVRKCGGLPLAIVVMGGLLSVKKSWDEWIQVEKNSRWLLSKGEEDRVPKILALSYNDLPHHLKLCFLYFSHFPDDSNIRVKKLIRLWVAEGFISQGREETMEAAAENCLHELVARCMVQVAKMSFGTIRACQVHDVLRDFSVEKSKEENFLEILGGTGHVHDAHSTKSRRHAIQSGYEISRYISLKTVSRGLRSLLILQSQFNHFDYKHLNFLWMEFKLLRILDLGNLSIGYLPDNVGKLIHLRYLGLKGSHLKVVPKSIGNLRSLQTLDMRSSYLPIIYTSLELPDVIWKMEELRHLLLDISYTKALRIDTLRNLQTLLSIKYGTSVEQGLIHLVNLRKLGIYDLSTRQINAVLLAVVKLNFLRSLSLSLSSEEVFGDLSPLSLCHRLLKLYLWGRIDQLPDPDVFPPNLTTLTLHASQLEHDPMEILGKLPNLIYLRLQHSAYRGKELLCTCQSFQRLQVLHLLGLYELEEWTLVEGAMPAFRRLEIWDCQNIDTLPVGLRFITTLQELVIGYMPKKFKDKVQGEDELYKIQHIPSITCY